jgi:ABC-type multidrug transport system ATPase subunit
MGVSGAGKTTLLDVLAGRKNSGYLEGSITVSGYPKRQETFARVSGYCEQNDIHSPLVTVYESLLYSAWLRLPTEIDAKTREVNKFQLYLSSSVCVYLCCNCLFEIPSMLIGAISF